MGAADPRTFRTLAPERAHNGISRARDPSIAIDTCLANYHNAERGVCATIVDSTHTLVYLTSLEYPDRYCRYRSGVRTPSTKFQRGTPRVFSAPFVSSPLSSPHRERRDRNRGVSRSRGSLAGTRGSARATRVRTRRARASERASGRDNESKGNRGDRAIDKTPNAARPRLILQAYTHPLVFSLSSPTTHPLDHYPLPPPPSPPPPPLLCPRLPPPPFPPPSVLLLPLVSLPLIPYVRPPLRTLRTLCEETHAPSEQPIYRVSLARFISLPPHAFSRSPFSTLRLSRDIVVFFPVSFSIVPYRRNPITFGQSNERARFPVLAVLKEKKKKKKKRRGKRETRTREERSWGFRRY